MQWMQIPGSTINDHASCADVHSNSLFRRRGVGGEYLDTCLTRPGGHRLVLGPWPPTKWLGESGTCKFPGQVGKTRVCRRGQGRTGRLPV